MFRGETTDGMVHRRAQARRDELMERYRRKKHSATAAGEVVER
jgi:hypothetical protein